MLSEGESGRESRRDLSHSIDGRLVAAAVGAIAAYLGRSPDAFQVRGIRPIADGTGISGIAGAAGASVNLWGLAGRQAQMLARTSVIDRRKELRP